MDTFTFYFLLLTLRMNIINATNHVIAISRKEVFQPHLPVRLPCYDLAPVTGLTLGACLPGYFGCYQLPWLDGRCVQGPGTYSPLRADQRLLAIPAS